MFSFRKPRTWSIKLSAVLLSALLVSGTALPETKVCFSQNIILSEYFLNQSVEKSGRRGSRGRPDYMGSRTVALAVDNAVGHYLTKIADDLTKLRETLAAVQRVRTQLLWHSSSAPRTQALWPEFKYHIGELGDHADRLRDRLSYPLYPLKSKEEFRFSASKDGDETVFEEEIRFIETQIAQAERSIINLFCSANHIVSVDRLGQENMLINLYRVSKVSQHLKKII